jgi:hypothetical protein
MPRHKKGLRYASLRNLFDLDAKSVQTMHEQNDVIAIKEDDVSLGPKSKEHQRQKHLAEEKGLDSHITPTIRDDTETTYSHGSKDIDKPFEYNQDWFHEESGCKWVLLHHDRISHPQVVCSVPTWSK